MWHGLRALSHAEVTVRPVRMQDAKALEHLLLTNRNWLERWEATDPTGIRSWTVAANVRSLRRSAKRGQIMPYVVLYQGELVGQLNVSQISNGALASAAIGYWISEHAAGRGIIPIAVALVTDSCMRDLGLHRIEICIRTDNQPSYRVVQKLGFRYEGLRRRYIHIDGDWRDHFAFSLVSDDLPFGLLEQLLSGRVRSEWADIAQNDRIAAGTRLA